MTSNPIHAAGTLQRDARLPAWRDTSWTAQQPRVDKSEEVWRGDVATVAALGTLILEFFLAYPAVIFRILLVAVLTLRARAAFLPALLLCQLYASDFDLANVQTYDYLVDRYEASRVTIFGFPITTNYVFAVCLTVTVLSRYLSRPHLFRGLISSWAVFLWCTCFPIALLAALVNLTDKTVSWTAPIRDVMMVGCVFFGIILAEDTQTIRGVVTRRLLPMFLCMLLLAWFGYFYARGMYWITAAGPAILFVKLLMGDRGITLWFAVVFAAVTTAYTFAIYPTAFAFGVAQALYSDNATTFALKGMWTGASVLVPLVILFSRAKRSSASPLARAPRLRHAAGTWIAAVVMIVFPVWLAAVSTRAQVELSSKRLSTELPWHEQFLFKLLYDRAPIYRGAIDEVLQPPYVFKAGSRASYRLMLDGDKVYWPAGSHNLVLEELRRNGWFSGTVCLGIMIAGMMWSCTAFIKTTDPFLTWYAAASFVTLLVSGVTSHIPMETNASIWLLTPCGVCAALYQHETSQNRQRSRGSMSGGANEVA
jgi:hypothetical protein